MLPERKKIHFKISKQKIKIQFLTFLRKFTKTHLIGQNEIKAIKTLEIYFSNTQYEIFEFKLPFKSSYDITEWCIVG